MKSYGNERINDFEMLKPKPRRGDIMVETTNRKEPEPRRGGIIKTEK